MIFHMGSYRFSYRKSRRIDLSRLVTKVIRSEKRYGNVSTGKFFFFFFSLLAPLFSSFQFRNVDKVLSFRISVKEVFGFSRAVALLHDHKDNITFSHVTHPSAKFSHSRKFSKDDLQYVIESTHLGIDYLDTNVMQVKTKRKILVNKDLYIFVLLIKLKN